MLRGIAGGADRVVVVDTETTGVYPSDRIVEIAIVTMSLAGEVIEEWDTLVHPSRDVGATHIHGITASMVESAPEFVDIAGDVASRLDGACVAAHNLSFDARMVCGEFDRIGIPRRIDSGLDTLAVTHARLGNACAQFGISIEDAHRALGDAMATARLLRRVAGSCDPGGPVNLPVEVARSGRVLRREDLEPVVLPSAPFVTHLQSRLDFHGIDAKSIAYLELVGRALADLHLDRDERAQLRELAGDLGLGPGHIARAHRRFENELIDAALADHVVTDDEYEALIRVAAALEVDQELVERRTRAARTVAVGLVLAAGLNVVFTGETDIPRSDLVDHAGSLGLVVQKNVTKKTDLVVAADPSSTSGKAGKARQYEIPIMAAAEFIAASDGQTVSAGRAETLKVITCPECFATTVAPPSSGSRASRLCEECRTLQVEQQD